MSAKEILEDFVGQFTQLDDPRAEVALGLLYMTDDEKFNDVIFHTLNGIWSILANSSNSSKPVISLEELEQKMWVDGNIKLTLEKLQKLLTGKKKGDQQLLYSVSVLYLVKKKYPTLPAREGFTRFAKNEN